MAVNRTNRSASGNATAYVCFGECTQYSTILGFVWVVAEEIIAPFGHGIWMRHHLDVRDVCVKSNTTEILRRRYRLAINDKQDVRTSHRRNAAPFVECHGP